MSAIIEKGKDVNVNDILVVGPSAALVGDDTLKELLIQGWQESIAAGDSDDAAKFRETLDDIEEPPITAQDAEAL